MDKIREWWYDSNQRRSTGGLVFMSAMAVAFLGVLVYIFMN